MTHIGHQWGDATQP